LYYGGKAHNDFAILPNGRPIVNPEAHHLSSVGLYAMAFYSPLPQINVKAGVRYQYNSLPVNHVSPFVGLSYYTSSHFQFYANYQTGFRTPTLMELYLFPSANPNLEEESTQSAELGAIYQPNASSRFRLTVFKNRADNLIQTVANPTPPPPVFFQNGPNSTPWGIEASARYQVLREVGLQISYGYLNPDLLTAYNPKQQIKYALFLQKPHFYFTLYGKYVGGLYARNNEQNPLPDYNVVNAQIGLHARNMEMYVRFLNILDRQYLSRPNYPAPGRQARIGIRWGLR
jgi:iron complex outermembrane receptor protein